MTEPAPENRTTMEARMITPTSLQSVRGGVRTEGSVYGLHVKPETLGERGLPKRPVPAVRLLRSGLDGDFNRWRHEEQHDDESMAVLLIPLETIEELGHEGWPVRPGDLGENVTSRGIPYDEFHPARGFAIGGARVVVTKACTPCTSLYRLPYVGSELGPAFLKATLNRRGWYARVSEEGEVRVGDPIQPLD